MFYNAGTIATAWIAGNAGPYQIQIQVAMGVVMVGFPRASTDLGNRQIDSKRQGLVNQVVLQPLNPWCGFETYSDPINSAD